MAQLPMYAAMVNSPGTELAADINATTTSIDVLDASKLPAAPNLVTVGGDETAETIRYTGKTGNTLTGCTRGFEGTAKGWAAGTQAARNHTAYDYEAGRANIADVLVSAEAFADGALDDANTYTDEKISAVTANYIRQPGYAATTGTASAYVATLTPTPSSLPDGFGITIVPHVASGASPTLNVNGLGAVALKKQDGSAFAAGDLKANTPYTFRKVGSDFLADNGGGEVDINGQIQQAVTYGGDIAAFDPVVLRNQLAGATIPALASNGRAARYSDDGTYLAVGHDSSPFLTIYKISGSTYTKLANPATLPTGIVYGVSWSSDGVYLAVSHAVSPFVTIYKRSGDTFTKLANPATLPTNTGFRVAFSPDGIYLAVGHDTSPSVTIYKRSGDTFTKLANPATLPTGDGRGVAFSPDNLYLTVGHTISPYLSIYKRSGDTFTKLSDPVELPTSIVLRVAWSPDGTKLSVAYNASPAFINYKRSGDTFTKLPDPPTLPTGNGTAVTYSRDGKYLGITHSSTPFITIYLVNGDQFKKIPDPNPALAIAGTSLDFKPSTNNVTVTYAFAPYISLYDFSPVAFKSDNLAADLVDAAGAGYALSAGTTGDTKDAIMIWR